MKDGRGRTTFTLRAGQQFETRYYDERNPRVEIVPGRSAVRTSYDSRGRSRMVEYFDRDPDLPGSNPVVLNPEAVLLWSEETLYDEAGNPAHVKRRDAAGATTWQDDRKYDVQHRLVEQSHPEDPARLRKWAFDTADLLSQSTDEESRAVTLAPDGLRRVGAVVQARLGSAGSSEQAQVATYGYRGYDLLSVTDGNGQVTSYAPDDFGDMTRVATGSFKAGAIESTYDARGNVLKRRIRDTGVDYTVVDYTYDGLDRLRTIVASDEWDGRQLSYEYRYDEDGDIGKLTSIVEPASPALSERTLSFDYDPAGRLVSETIVESGVTAPLVTGYGYDAKGRLTTLTYPSGLIIAFDPDEAGRVKKIRTSDEQRVFANSITRWPGGPVHTFTFGNGETFTYDVNRRYEPDSIRSGPLALDYVMSSAGDVSVIEDGSATYRYGYDFRDRLVAFSPGYGSAPDITYEYATGASGQRTDRLKRSGTFNASSLVTGHAYDYDYQTNVSSIGRVASGSVTEAICLRHDALGRLVLVGTGSNAGGDQLSCVKDADITQVTARYKYDAHGRRIARWLAATGQWTYFVHGPSGELLSELTLTGSPPQWTPVRDYVWLEGRPLVQLEYAGSSGAPRAYYFHVDHLGTPRKLTGADGTTVWSSTAQPYGEVTETTTPDPVTGQTVVTNLRLPGQYDERLLGSLGLQGPYYNWNRWYLPGVGRYLELDPIALGGKFNGFFGPNWYGYAEGNPMRFADPSGLAVYLCRRVAEIPGNPGFTHHWIVTGAGSGGMGPCGGGIPGQGGGSDSPYVTQTCNNDHSGDSPSAPGVICELIEDVDEQCVNEAVLKCAELGTWSLWNQCQTYAADVLKKCTKHENTCSP